MSTEKWTTTDIPDQTGRVVVVTGANSGLGLQTATTLAGKRASVVLAVRNLERGQAAIDSVRQQYPDADLQLQHLDLASLDSIRTAAEEMRERHDRVDLLVNNAGAMYTSRAKTADGFGIQFGTNHLGHFAWTGLLIDRLLDVPGSRVVTLSSVAHSGAPEIDFDALPAEPEQRGTLLNRLVFRSRAARATNVAYGRSKLANLLFTYELQRRLAFSGAPTIAVAAHPGLVHTTLLHDIPGTRVLLPLMRCMSKSVEQGVLPILRAATDPGVLGGQYYGPNGFMGATGDHPVVVTSSARSYDAEAQRRLWTVSEELTGITFPLSPSPRRAKHAA